MQTKDVAIILLIGLLISGLVFTGIPYTNSQFANQNDINYTQWLAGDYNGYVAYMDWNKISFIDINDLNIPTGTGTTITDTNFQTAGYNDLNMDLNYLQTGDNISLLVNDVGYITSGGGVSFGTVGQIPYTNATTDDFDYSSDLYYDGSKLYAKGIIRTDNTGSGASFIVNRTDGKSASLQANPTGGFFAFDDSGEFRIIKQPSANILSGSFTNSNSNTIIRADTNGSVLFGEVGSEGFNYMAGSSGGSVKVSNTGSGASFIVNRTDGKSASLQANPVGGFFAFDDSGEFRIVKQPSANILSGSFTNSDPNTIITADNDGSILFGEVGSEGFIYTPSGDVKITNDSKKLYFGAGDDTSIYYDGTNLNINPQEVGSGDVLITSGKLKLDELYSRTHNTSSYINFDDDQNTAVNMLTIGSVSGQNYIMDDNNNSSTDSFTWWRDNPDIDLATKLMTLNNDGDLIFSTGSNYIRSDNENVFFGASDDSSISYDGADMVFNSQEKGLGDFVFNGGNIELEKSSPKLLLDNTGGNGKSSYIQVDNTNNLIERIGEAGKAGATAYSLYPNGVSGEYGQVSDNSVFDLDSTDATWSIWVKSSTQASNKGIFGKWQTNNGWLIFQYPANQFSFQANTATKRITSTGTWATDTWHNLVVIKTGSTFEFFVDKVSQGTTSTTLSTNTQNVQFGAYTGVNIYDGALDEAVIWNRALTSAEKDELYDSTLYIDPASSFASTGTPMDTNLVAVWHFDEGTGTAFNDSSGNEYNGVYTGAEGDEWTTGNIAIPASDVETNIWKLEDGVLGGEAGILSIGDTEGKTILQAGTGIYLEDDTYLQADNRKQYFGTGDDSSITYDGTNLIFDSQEVGSGDFVFNNGDLNVGTSIVLRQDNNITMKSPDGTNWNCGVNNSGVFTCS